MRMASSDRVADSVSAVPKVSEARRAAVGVVGAGQLARMLVEAASALGVDVAVLAASAQDAACPVAGATVVGSPQDPASLLELAELSMVVTFDHELVDLDALAKLSELGHLVRPSPAALAHAAHKDHQRQAMSAAGVPVPDFLVMTELDERVLVDFAAALGAAPVVKAARGGYDGRGVVLAADLDAAVAATRSMIEHGPVVLEEPLELLGEYAVLVASAPSGERRHWPVVRTLAHDHMCAEVHYPSGLPEELEAEAVDLARRVADVVRADGVMAVELFRTSAGLVLNEVATRPHNSGHWTIEGASTSQFENHLRAVRDLPLGDTSPLAPAAVMVNVVGAGEPGDLAGALAVDGAHVHLYGKSWRPGRKLGHVTVVGDDLHEARVRAWQSAGRLGTVATMEEL
jgi:5-(carboxyamino)imidazole ribonucleotide synthase